MVNHIANGKMTRTGHLNVTKRTRKSTAPPLVIALNHVSFLMASIPKLSQPDLDRDPSASPNPAGTGTAWQSKAVLGCKVVLDLFHLVLGDNVDGVHRGDAILLVKDLFTFHIR
jgi:hypothetical protein